MLDRAGAALATERELIRAARARWSRSGEQARVRLDEAELLAEALAGCGRRTATCGSAWSPAGALDESTAGGYDRREALAGPVPDRGATGCWPSR